MRNKHIYTEEEVKEELLKHGYNLISQYNNFNDIYVFEDDKYKYQTRISGIIRDNSSPPPFSKNNPYVIQNIKNYININNIQSLLLSDKYEGNCSPLLFQCNCENKTIFKRSWADFLQGHNVCTSCSIKRSDKYNMKHEWENIVKYFNEKQLELISTNIQKNSDRIKFICPKHRQKGEQSATWNQLKSKHTGCKYCACEYIGKLKRVPEDVIKELTTSKGFEYVSVEYNNSKATINYKCKIHSDKGIHKMSYMNMKKSSGKCPYCTHRNTNEEILQERVNEINKNIKIVGKYSKSNKKIECLCTIHDSMFRITPNQLINGHGCPICGHESMVKKRTKTHADFCKEVYNKFGNSISVISKYNGARNKVHCVCNKHNYEFDICASNLITSVKLACPLCIGEDIHNRCAKTNSEFINELKKINPNIVPVGNYINISTKILCKCKIHNYEWYAMPLKILSKHTGCPKCSLYNYEEKICDLLDDWGYKYICQKRFVDCKDVYTLPFDIYLYEYNILIEYDGEQHFRIIPRGKKDYNRLLNDFNIIVKHDIIKTQYCKENNIPLIRISYEDIDDLEYVLFDQLVKYNAIKIA